MSDRIRLRSPVWAWAFLVLLTAALTACAAKNTSYAESYTEDPSAMNGYDAGGIAHPSPSYDYDEDMAETDDIAVETVSLGRGLASRDRGANRRQKRATKASPPSPVSTKDDTGLTMEMSEDSVPPPDSPEQPAPPLSKVARQVIYTAEMYVEVYATADAVATAEALPDRLGGWLHARRDDMVILRIPAEHLDEAMDLIAELGVVLARNLLAEDVTAAYTDLESRIRVLEQMQIQLQALLDRAKTVEQALQIRRALDGITLELELARTHMREMAKSIAFSTLTVYFLPRGPETLPSSNDPFPWTDTLGVEGTEYR